MKGLSTTLAAAVLACCALPGYAQFPPGMAGQKYRHYSNSLAPYVVSPQTIVERMLEIADLKPGETLYDLGSGDGRILITAVQHFRAKAVGIEISDSLVQSTNERIKQLGLQSDARVIHGDMRDVDLSPADVVTIYLMTDSNEIIRPNLEKYLKAGARVVSHDYPVPNWKAKRIEKSDPGDHAHLIYLYEMPPAKK